MRRSAASKVNGPVKRRVATGQPKILAAGEADRPVERPDTMKPERLTKIDEALRKFNHREYPETYYDMAVELLAYVKELKQIVAFDTASAKG